jgi:hypothetical protein
MTKQEIIEQIAEKHLFIETLEARGRDMLDFYDCNVLSIKAALEAAYEAGKGATNA